MNIGRRSLILGMMSALAAPAVIRVAPLMRISKVPFLQYMTVKGVFPDGHVLDDIVYDDWANDQAYVTGEFRSKVTSLLSRRNQEPLYLSDGNFNRKELWDHPSGLAIEYHSLDFYGNPIVMPYDVAATTAIPRYDVLVNKEFREHPLSGTFGVVDDMGNYTPT